MREGGSIPIIGDLKEIAGLDSLLIGLFTPADNLHAPDESFHLGIMEKATTAFESIFEDLAGPSWTALSVCNFFETAWIAMPLHYVFRF